MLADQTEQMSLAEHDDVVEQFAPQRADPPLGESVLPWQARRGPHLPVVSRNGSRTILA
jgi:hypothetical protein